LGGDVTEFESSEKLPGVKIQHLIYETKDFIVWIREDLDIDWQTEDSYDESIHTDRAKHRNILNRAAMIECIPNSHHEKRVRIDFKRMIGEAIARSLEGDYNNAEKILDSAAMFIEKRNIEKARYWQILSAIMYGFIIAIFTVLGVIFKNDIIKEIGESAVTVLIAFSGGSMGAVLFMIFRIGKVSYTSESPRSLHFLESLGRMVAGGLCGVIVGGGVRLGAIVPMLSSTNMPFLGIFLAGIGAGYSERWAPSLLEKMGTVPKASS
jgi:hypothetical protein